MKKIRCEVHPSFNILPKVTFPTTDCDGCLRAWNLTHYPVPDWDSISKRFIDKVCFRDGCWEWQGVCNWRGYGQFKLHGWMQQAHRAAYMLFVGNIPAGYDIDHLCFNRACVRLDHLEPVTPAQNTQRAYRNNRGQRHRKTG